ncbi:MAG: ribonuclease H-like domain-containing protein, partial [Spirochaetaceae bacterium]|nr:ribonuclease H-like domain-containing protein [Spirochaetaceae bacterium]
MDIRSRLSRIRNLRPPAGGARGEGREPAAAGGPAGLHRAFKEGGWIPLDSPAGALTLRKSRVLRLPLPLPPVLPPALAILTPGGGGLSPESLRFFDLETTGLSIGAGTIPFMAAVGVPERGGKGGYDKIRIVQYLLLDYPGEGEFLEALVKEFRPLPPGPERRARGGTGEISPETPPAAVSYNGKTFDVPILRNRCLMQGLALP